MAKIPGKNGSVKIGSVTIPIIGWDGTFQAETIEVNDTGSGGYTSTIGGLKKASGSFKAYYDGASPPEVDEGDEVDATFLVTGTGATTSRGYNVPFCTIKDLKIKVDVKGAVEYEVSWENNGLYTKLLPTP